jgi:hypothetical protein
MNLFVLRPLVPAFFLGFVSCQEISTAGSQWGPAHADSPAYSVVYTGRLFGYFRYPDEQSTKDSGCPSLNQIPPPAQVEQFRSTLRQISSNAHPDVLVAMGGNFAPELLAREMRNEEAGTLYQGQMVDKDTFTTDAEGRQWQSDFGLAPTNPLHEHANFGKVPSDNVACFMRLVGFNAVVPGQEDFYFGAGRLRQLARFLAQPAMPDYRPVQMLAANLSITSTVHSPAPRLPNGALRKPLQDALKESTQFDIQLPKAVMPWFRTLRITGTSPDTAFYDCIASRDDPNDFALPLERGNKCTRLQPVTPDPSIYSLLKPANPSANFISDYYTLDPGDNHAICISNGDAGRPATSCKLFSVQYPFFQYAPASSGTTPAPYYVSSTKAANGQRSAIAVFGIMDPSLVGMIGQFEDTWLNQDRRFDTRIQITDPVEALRQVLQLCDADANCKSSSKVLLAQMPYYKATQLAAKLGDFDVIIAQADANHATGDETRSKTDSRQKQPFVLTPGTAFDPSRDAALNVNLRTASLYFETGSEGDVNAFLANRVYDSPVKPAAPLARSGAVNALGAAVAGRQKGLPGSAQNYYEELALQSMQRFCGTDIALLQHRDIFTDFQKAVAYWPASRRYEVQQLLDEALWKGDFAFCLPVKGSTLKKMLQESAAFDQEDHDNLSLEIQRGRGLSTLGIAKDPVSGEPLIRGQLVEDNKLYGVGMTDYLAFGDTGYPELSSEAILPRVRVTSLQGLDRLTGLTCQQLPVSLTANDCQTREIQASQYFDAIANRPFDTSPGLAVLRYLRLWATHPLQPQQRSAFLAEHAGTHEAEVERRGLWWFTLQNMSLEYDLTFVRGSDEKVPSNFSGINTFPQLSTPESSQLGLWTRARGGYAFRRYIDFYVSGEEKYTRSAVRISDASGNGNFGPYQLTLKDNAVRAELGLLSKPVSNGIPVRALVSENLFTQVADPFDQLAVPVPCNTANCIPGSTTLGTFNLGKNFLVMTRLGARLQNKQSWFEAGREYGENIGIPLGYTIEDVGRPQPFSCALSGNYSLSQCISADPLFTIHSKILSNLINQPIAGWFADLHIAAPIYRSKLTLAVDSYAEIFDKRRDDTSFNTRFYEDLTVSLKVPLWGNLTFAPQVETFVFQNKVIPNQPLVTNHYTFVTSSMKLEYGFDWHRGIGLVRALRYPSGISTSSSPSVPVP